MTKFDNKREGIDPYQILDLVKAASLEKYTLQDVYDEWHSWKKSSLTHKSMLCYEEAWKYRLSILAECEFDRVELCHLQKILDNNAHYSKSLLDKYKQLCVHLYNYALRLGITAVNYGSLLQLPSDKASVNNEYNVFSQEQIRILIQYASNKSNAYWNDARIVLALIFTGWRPNELFSIETEKHVNIEDGYFIGGSKTRAGRNRVVPILGPIQPYVLEWYTISRNKNGMGSIYLVSAGNGNRMNLCNWRTRHFYPLMLDIGFHSIGDEEPIYKPYSCRHTLATLADEAGVNNDVLADVIGHTNPKFTNRVYIHRRFERVRDEVKKIETLFA